MNVVKAITEYDNSPVDPEVSYINWKWSKRVGLAHPARCRAVKSSIMNNLNDYNTFDEETRKIYDRYREFERLYGRDSMMFNTLIRSVSLAEYSVKQVQDMRLKDRSIPPAFDRSKRAPQTKLSREYRRKLENYVKEGRSQLLNQMRSLFKREIAELEKQDYRYTLLTNGTTTTLEWHGIDINDILGIMFIPEDLVNNKYLLRLGRYFKVLNCGTSDLTYIEIPQCEKYSITGGEHLEIPDKDGKIREVYRLYPWIQVVSKAVHQFLDKIARKLEGNYTYKHRDWLKRAIKEGWNKNKYLIGTDMSKYSDTLDRDFIMFLLEEMGIPKAIIEALDWLYSQGIYDILLDVYYSETEATYQGQYGDFPMITVANLTLQDFVYYLENLPHREGYSAAVGDDTGMIFDKYKRSIMDTIIEVYGCVGVRINKTKTGELIMGEGRIDFVKLEMTKDGIIPFLNMRSIENNNVDAFIRDVFELESSTVEDKFRILEIVFGSEASRRLRDLSIINGGLNNRPIEKRDVIFYVNRTQQLHSLMGYEPDETERGIEEIRRYLREGYPGGPFYLYETPLNGYCTLSYEERENSSPSQIDDNIELNILNMMKLGLTFGNMKNYSNWLGKIPLELKAEWEKRDSDITKNFEDSDIWEDIQSYETFAAKRKHEQARTRRKISTMLPIINGLYDVTEDMRLPDNMLYPELEVKTMEEYKRAVIPYRAKRNKDIICERLRGVANFTTEDYFGIKYHYVYVKNGRGGSTKYRMYNVFYRSEYEILPQSLFYEWVNSGLLPKDLSYGDMITYWSNADRVSWNQLPDTIMKYGYH